MTKTILQMLITLVTAVVIGTLLLIGVYYLPTDNIKKNVAKSVDQLVEETDHYSLFPGTHTTKQDNYSDAEYLNAAMVDNNARGIFTGLYGLEYNNASVEIPYDSPVTVLKNVFNEDADIEYKEYGVRFWNGYEVIVKPLLLLFTYGQIRHINFYLEAALLIIMIILMIKRGLMQYAVPVVISYLLLEPVPMAASMAFAGFLYCTYIPCIIMLLFNDKLKQGNLYPGFFVLIGAAVTYFNMNYFQLITFAYALMFYFMLNGFPGSIKKTITGFLTFFICWLFGYGGMTALKWVIYELCTGNIIIHDMIARAMYRASATAYYTGPHISRFYAMLKNIYYLATNGMWMLFEIVYVVILIYRYKKGNAGSGLISKSGHTAGCSKNIAPEIILFVLMLLLALTRYLVFANHVYVHAWATYRILDVAVLAFNILIAKVLRKGDTQYEEVPADSKN